MVQGTDGTGSEGGSGEERPQPVEQEEKAVEAESKTRKPKPVAVKVIRREKKAALVEWIDRGKYHRASVPAREIQDGTVDNDVLEAGIPYGERWRDVDGVTAEIEQELYRHGIWTRDDLLANSHQARNAVQKMLVGPVMSALLKKAKQ